MLADFDDLRQLPIADKLRIVDLLWDDIRNSNEEFPLAEWDRLELERRVAEIDSDPSSLLTEEEMWRQADNARG